MLERKTTIKTIIQNPNNYEGKQVIVSGNFKGWKGSCFSAPPVTRSDWMIEDEGQCIYVSGDLPGGLDAMKPSGEEITIEATVKVDQKGKPYLVK